MLMNDLIKMRINAYGELLEHIRCGNRYTKQKRFRNRNRFTVFYKSILYLVFVAIASFTCFIRSFTS